MLKNYFKIAIRNVFKYKGYSFINLFGLSIGIACFILIFLYVWNEMNYDNFHNDVDRIYRIYEIDKTPNGESLLASTSDPLPGVLKNDYPDLGNITRLFYQYESWITVNRNSFKEDIYFTDPSFFEIFSFPFIKGNSKTALENINSVVLTEELAKKYFGNEEPMGKILTTRNQDFIVTGVLKNLPPNTSIKFNILMPAKLRSISDPDFEKRWWSSGTYTFVKLSDKFTPEMLKKQFQVIIDKYFPDFLKGRMNFGVQPLRNMHLGNEMEVEMVPQNSKTYLYILMLIGFSIILIASINFMNLSTARYSERTKEIGMRKTIGAGKSQLIIQFLGESVSFCFLSLIIGIALVELCLPEFHRLSGKELSLNYTTNIWTFISLLVFGILFGVFSGIYPAFFLASYQPIDTLKNRQKKTKLNLNFRRSLVIIQFAISILLIAGEIVIIKQLNFMKNRKLGFDPKNVIVVSTQQYNIKDFESKINVYLNSILIGKEQSGIISASISENVPGYYYQNRFGVIPEGSREKNPLEMIITSIDDKFLNTYGIQIMEGRNFSKEFGTDQYSSVLISESAAKKIGWQNPIGKTFKFAHGDGPYIVTGVVNDIHFRSLQHTIEPLIYRYIPTYAIGYISIRYNSANSQFVLNFLEKEWRKTIQDVPFEYFFLADKFNSNYIDEEKTAEIIGFFTLVAIILACMGLFGLVAIMITQRTKEIGIRKVLGASIPDIITMLSKDLTKWIIIANIFAWPIAYYLMNRWLQNFAYRINIEVWTFILSGLLVLIIAFFSISFHVIKVAISNPVRALRYE
jgi:putative ABC transport system permease protein